ncbi:putative monooxygenase [Podospora appendiculata]|uniref:Monooxygenase n=1 Tax=Podospora appendiculata TaxID=314037 RepID=A0AAE0X2B7_9PEZI|nr:putative monooxygenase [Podospora appendiculata]
MATETANPAAISVAIVGLGIAGATTALGLLSRGLSVKIYERAAGVHEIGAGIGMSPNAERAMLALDPRIHAAFRRIATPNTEDWFQYVDGYHDAGHGDGEAPLFKMYLGTRGFEGCRRADLLDELAKLLPDGCAVFNKELVQIDEATSGQKPMLKFADGTSVEADVVLGCDGIRSRVRRHVLGEENPAAVPGYTHKFAFRGLVPTAKARTRLTEDKCTTRYMHLGQDGHVLTFPVAMGAMINVVAFVTDRGAWPGGDKMTLPATKAEAARCFADFGPVVRTVIDLLDDKLDKWAIFDTFDHPAGTYVSPAGTTCLIGDAAHASSPHHGAGAGCAIEDALALATALEEAQAAAAAADGKEKRQVLRAALAAYDAVRLERTHWLVESSRFTGELYEWQVPECGRDPVKCLREAEARCHQVWDYDVGEMVDITRRLFAARLHRGVVLAIN